MVKALETEMQSLDAETRTVANMYYRTACGRDLDVVFGRPSADFRVSPHSMPLPPALSPSLSLSALNIVDRFLRQRRCRLRRFPTLGRFRSCAGLGLDRRPLSACACGSV